jgi:hypothetical protein
LIFFNPRPKKKRIELTEVEKAKLKLKKYRLANFRCECCGRFLLRITHARLHHIRSRGAGGGDTVENTRILCWWCHRLTHDGNI